MDFSWMPHYGMFWMFPLLCVLFMVVMMMGCGGMRFRLGHRGRDEQQETPRQILDRRYASGEIDKGQYDAVRRALDG